jgi:Xaa-Pro dipeptidase
MLTRRRFLLSAATAPAFSLYAQEPSATTTTPKPDTPKPADQAACEDTLPPSLLELKDRTKDIVPIDVHERETRLDLARALMKQYGIDAILVTTGASLRYFTGINWGQSERLFCWVLPQSAAPVMVCPYMERDRLSDLIMPQAEGDAQPHTVLPERQTTLFYLWQENEDPFDILKRALAEVDVNTGTLGIEEHTAFGFVTAIGHAAPALKLVSATPVTAGCRSIKSPAEIALMRLANHITFDVYKAAYLACAPGDTNHRFEDLVNKGYARSGVHGEVSCNVGVNSAIPHGSPHPQVIREGEMILIDDGCQVDGYWSDISRSFVYGKPTDFQRTIFEIVHNAQAAALGAAGPGVPMEVPDAAARQVMRDAKYGAGYEYFTHRLGHGMGLDMHEWPYLVQGNKQKMIAGMVFSDEPGLYLKDKFGIRLEDDMLITDKGAELFLWQSPSLQDPFAIPAVLPQKNTKDTKHTIPDTTPSNNPSTTPNPGAPGPSRDPGSAQPPAPPAGTKPQP